MTEEQFLKELNQLKSDFLNGLHENDPKKNKKILSDSEKLQILVAAVKNIEKYWDFSDLSNIRPSIESMYELGGIKKIIRNDSMAAGSLVKAVRALKEIE